MLNIVHIHNFTTSSEREEKIPKNWRHHTAAAVILNVQGFVIFLVSTSDYLCGQWTTESIKEFLCRCTLSFHHVCWPLAVIRKWGWSSGNNSWPFLLSPSPHIHSHCRHLTQACITTQSVCVCVWCVLYLPSTYMGFLVPLILVH